MKVDLKSIKIIILLSFSFCSCSTQPQRHATLKTVDKVEKDIPLDARGNPMWFYKKKADMEKMVGISSIENGFDSLQMRIWYGVALRDKLQLLILKNSGAEWSAELDSLALHYDKNRDSIVSITKIIEPKKPVSGWDKFVVKLDKLGIFTLPDAHDINDYTWGQDGYGVTIEFATKNRYRIYNYPNFKEQNEVKEAKQIEQIMELIENEFGFTRLSIK